MTETNDRFDVPGGEEPWRLCPDDEAAIDRLIAQGFENADCPRTTAAASCFRLLSDYPASDAEDVLVHATLARVNRYEQESAVRLRMSPSPNDMIRGRRFRISDLITVAAVILVAVGITIPLLHQVRRNSIETACANNLRIAGGAMQTYANDFHGSLPMTAGLPNMFSWHNAEVQDNPLDLLAQLGYCDHGHINCPGHDADGPAFSHQMQTASRRVAFGTGPVVAILGDRNPVIDAVRAGRPVSLNRSTANHDGRGQNVLLSDGVVEFLRRPMLHGNDNIWLPRTPSGDETLNVIEVLLSPGDSVLVH